MHGTYKHINVINALVNNIQYYGLFPTSLTTMKTVAPSMFFASEYDTNITCDTKDVFKEACCDITDRSDNALSALTNCDLSNEPFLYAGQNISMRIAFNLHYTYLFH